jgi:hypothetical protein
MLLIGASNALIKVASLLGQILPSLGNGLGQSVSITKTWQIRECVVTRGGINNGGMALNLRRKLNLAVGLSMLPSLLDGINVPVRKCMVRHTRVGDNINQRRRVSCANTQCDARKRTIVGAKGAHICLG